MDFGSSKATLVLCTSDLEMLYTRIVVCTVVSSARLHHVPACSLRDCRIHHLPNERASCISRGRVS